MDDFFEAYFGESDGDEFEDIKKDLAPKEKIGVKDSFKIFKVLENGQQEE